MKNSGGSNKQGINMGLCHRKAQSIAEYALLLAVVVSALITMQVYVKRGLQGRLRDASDFVVNAMNEGLGSSYLNQYEPAYRISNTDMSRESSLLQEMSAQGNTAKYYLDDRTDVVKREKTAQVVGYDDQD